MTPSAVKRVPCASKEEAHDYRYFPDPDLLPLTFSAEFVEDIARSLPELPDDKKKRFMEEYSLSAYDAGVLVSEPKMPIFSSRPPRARCQGDANMVIGSVFAGLNKAGLTISESPVQADQIGQLVNLISDQTISSRIAKDVFDLMFDEGPDQGRQSG